MPTVSRPRCIACGRAIAVSHAFCPHCGARVAREGAGQNVIGLAPPPEVSEELRSFVAGRVGARLGEVDEQLATERRLVTALFADVSGFTKLAERLETEQLLEVIDPVVTRLANVVGRFEGYVEKFAGDALLALFVSQGMRREAVEENAPPLQAAPVNGAGRAVGRIRGEVPGTEELRLHVGINTGHGIARMIRSEVRTDYAVLGESVILAQRLESAAPSGEVYVSDTTYRATHDNFDYELVGDLSLKGKSEAVRAWRLIRERPAAARPLPRGREITRQLVGRERELAELDSVIGGLVSGNGAFVVVTGEAGIGKSRLTEELRRRAESKGARWLEGRCLSYGAGLAYWPYVDLIRRFADAGIEESAEVARSRLSVALERYGLQATLPFFARLLGVSSSEEGIADLEPQAFRRGLHRSIAELIEALSRESPLVMVIEDLHWADASSLMLTRELADVGTRAPFVLFGTARPEAELGLGEVRGRRSIALGPLDEAAVATLVQTILDATPPARLVPFILARTAGNPFFVEELVRALRETGSLRAHDGMWTIQAGWNAEAIPQSLEGILAARIDLLPLSTTTVLGNASVIGRRVRMAVLRAISGGALEIDTAVGALVQGGFLERVDEIGDALTFHHALIQDVAYSRLLGKTKRDIHRRVADAIEVLYGTGDDVVDLLARHHYLGAAGAKAIDYLMRAGARAKQLFANDEAITHLERAAELVRKDAQLAHRLHTLLLDLADLQELVGDYEKGFELYREVRDATNDVRSWRGMAAMLRGRGRMEEALTILGEAFASDDLKGKDLLPLRLEEAWNLNASGRQDEIVKTLRAALETAGTRRDETIAQLLLQLARREAEVGEAETALAHALDARAIFEEREDVRGLATATRVVGGVYYRLRRLDEAREVLRRGLALAERVGSVEEIGFNLINLGMVELRRGALDEAITYDRRAIEEFERVGRQTSLANAYANLAEKLMHHGDYEEALGMCEKAIELARGIGYSLWEGDATQTKAAIELRLERLAEAEAHAVEAASIFDRIGARPRVAEALTLAAEASEKAGEMERARDYASRAR